MTTYYSQPAAANYNTAPLHPQRQRGYRICDQCGTVETPAVKFRLCGGCVSHHTHITLCQVLTTTLVIHLDDHTILCTLPLTISSL